MQRHQLLTDAFVGFRKSLLEPASDHVHLALRLLKRDPGLQSPNRHQPMIDPGRVAGVGGIDRNPHVYSIAVETLKPCRHDSNDSCRGSVKAKAFSENLRITIKLALPIGLTDHH